MGYTKKWIPPTIPLRDDLSAWKTLFQDLHDNLLLAGLVQTDTAGQLVIADVATLPADGAYAGFCEYAFDDDLQATAPVVIKLEYGCGQEGLSANSNGSRRTRTPRVRASVTFSGVAAASFQCPQESSGGTASVVTTQLTSSGVSYVVNSPEAGFFALVYGAGSRNNPVASVAGGYTGATLTLFVQRDVDSNGMPTPGGVMLFAPNLTSYGLVGNLWTDGILPPSLCQFVGATAGLQRSDLAMRLGGNSNSLIAGEIQTQQIFAATPHLKPWPTLVSYNYLDIPDGTEFSLEVFPGSPQNFIALGRETSISIDPLIGQRGALAMLFE